MSEILGNNILRELHCFRCEKYISVGPVKQEINGVSKNVRYICGRCNVFLSSNDITKIFEILCKNSLFSCIYDVDGCSAKMVFGEEVVHHERVCDYRPTACPVIDSGECEWNGPAITSFEHCLDKHRQCTVVAGNEFEFNNLGESVDMKGIMRRQNGDVFVLHLNRRGEKNHMSVHITFLICKNDKNRFPFTLSLHSSCNKQREFIMRNITSFSSCNERRLLEQIPYNILSYFAKEMSIKIRFEEDPITASS